jgi:hypothetical protein
MAARLSAKKELARGGYFPGAGTAPLLLATSVYLIARLSAKR